jgi:signal peptidase I
MGGNLPKIKFGKAILGALATALFMKLFLFDFMIAEGQSMVPAIRNGAVLVVNKLAYGLRLPFTPGFLLRWSLPKEGDVVVFYSPRGDLAVKRCTGIPGEGLFFLRGDNSRDSYDSRSYGPVPADRIIGKVLGVK